jgi:hypothetical protein
LGVIGSLIGALALIAAVLPHWIVPVIFPPPAPDQVIVDTGHRLKERLVARAKGIEYQVPKPEKTTGGRLSEASSVAAISLGLLAILFALLSLVFRQERLLAGMAAALGAGAIAIGISFFVMYAMIAIAIIYAVVHIVDLF